MYDKYESPLVSRYASQEMIFLFSPYMRIKTWRKLWVSLAKAQHFLGLNITKEQIEELENHIDDIDFDYAGECEKKMHHDVMAHIHAYGKVCEKAAGIIHLGATSCFVTDNADLILYKEALLSIRESVKKVISALYSFSDKYKSVPTLGFTHYQPAQLVTVGKRATLWLQELYLDLEEIDFVIGSLRFLGCRGTTGTEASFLELFDNDGVRVDRMNEMIARDFGFDSCFYVCGQTYPRIIDSRIIGCLSQIAQSAYKIASDIRLLQHDRQLEEPFAEKQVGSSAMAYKRNPMRCERICSLSRYLMSDALNCYMTASTQWLERTLDDSANRRISMPEGFLCADGILRILLNVCSNITVNDKIIQKAVEEYLPFIATENLLMEGVKRGGNRQVLHEVIRSVSMEEIKKMKNGEEYDLLSRLSDVAEFNMSKEEMKNALKPEKYIGRCIEQVDNFLRVIKPVIEGADTENSEIPEII